MHQKFAPTPPPISCLHALSLLLFTLLGFACNNTKHTLQDGVRTFADQTFAGRRFPTNICRSDKCRPWHLPTKTFADQLLVSLLLIWQLPTKTFSENDIYPPWQLPTVTFSDLPWHLPTVTFADRDICRPRHLPTRTFADQGNCSLALELFTNNFLWSKYYFSWG